LKEGVVRTKLGVAVVQERRKVLTNHIDKFADSRRIVAM